MKTKPTSGQTDERLTFSDGEALTYSLIRSRRRTLSVEITREGLVVVRAPMRLPKREIEGFLRGRQGWIVTHRAAQLARAAAHPAPDAQEEARLRALAKQVLPPLVARYAARMGVHPTGITVTGAKTRFGSCSPKDRLSFSFRLMQYPPAAVEYVVVHELAHIRVRNHSAAFYAEVEKILPDWRQRQALLRK